MDQTISTWHARVVVAVLVVILLVVGVGMGSVAAEANTTEDLIVNQTTEPPDIYLNDSTHEIEDIDIQYKQESDEYNRTHVYVGFSELQHHGINVTSAVIDDVTVKNGTVSNTSKIEDSNQTVFKIEIEHENNLQEFTIVSIMFDKLDTENGKMSSNMYYNLGAVAGETDSIYQDVVEEEKMVESANFKLIGGSFAVPDQATGSTQITAESRTSPAVTVENINTNIDSEVVITEGHNGTTISEIKSISTNSTEDIGDISLKSQFIGGNISAYLIPSTRIDVDQYEQGDELPTSVIRSATAQDNAQIVLGSIEFNNQEFDSPTSSNITISSSEIRDNDGMETPYIISIHPVTAEDKIVHEKAYGYSEVLKGANEDTEVEIKDFDGEETTIWHSNQFVAVLRLAKNYSVGEIPDLSSTQQLPNSDLDDQFVTGGVSDKGNIIISRDNTTSNTSNIDIEYSLENKSYSNETIYAGSTVAFDSNETSSDTIKIYQIVEDNQSVTAGIINNRTNLSVNTTNFQTGEYYLSGENTSKSDVFKIVGKNDQYSKIKADRGKYRAGNLIYTELQHNILRTQIIVTNIHNNSTTATINLSTPEKGNTSIGFNTYAAGNTSLTDAIVTTDNTVTVDSIETSTPNGTLPPGDYELSVQSEHGDAKTETNTTFTLQNRSTNGVTPYTTNEKDSTDLGTTETIRSAIANETLSPSSTISTNQTVVYAVNASGLTGLPAVKNVTLETGADLREFSGYSFGVQPSTSAELTTVDTTDTVGNVPDDSTVHVDDSRLYLVANGDDALGTDDPSDGEEYTATFRVDDDHLRTTATDPSADHTVTTTLTVADLDDQQGSNAVDEGDSDGHDDSTAGTTPVDNGHNDGSSAGGGPTGGGSTGGGPADADAERNTGSSATNPTDSAISGVTDADEPGVPDGEYGAAVRQLPSLHTPHPTVPATIRFSSGTDENPPDTSERATAASTGQEQLRETPEQTDEFREPDAPGYDEAPIRSTAYDIPGFGPIVTLVSLLTASYFAARRQ